MLYVLLGFSLEGVQEMKTLEATKATRGSLYFEIRDGATVLYHRLG